MKKNLTIITLCLAAFMLPRLIYHSTTTWVFGLCDPKFGCLGTWQIELFIAATFGLLSLLSLLPNLLYFGQKTFNRYLLSASLLLAWAYEWFLTTRLFNSTLEVAITWFLFAGLLYALACGFSTQRRRQLN